MGNGEIAVAIVGAGKNPPRYAIETDEVERFKKQKRRLHVTSKPPESDLSKWWKQQRIERDATPEAC
jgi:hypothetical protein